MCFFAIYHIAQNSLRKVTKYMYIQYIETCNVILTKMLFFLYIMTIYFARFIVKRAFDGTEAVLNRKKFKFFEKNIKDILRFHLN